MGIRRRQVSVRGSLPLLCVTSCGYVGHHRLDDTGHFQARELRRLWPAALESKSRSAVRDPTGVELVIVSPLTRAMQTASTVFEGVPSFQAVELCREAHGLHPVRILGLCTPQPPPSVCHTSSSTCPPSPPPSATSAAACPSSAQSSRTWIFQVANVCLETAVCGMLP